MAVTIQQLAVLAVLAVAVGETLVQVLEEQVHLAKDLLGDPLVVLETLLLVAVGAQVKLDLLVTQITLLTLPQKAKVVMEHPQQLLE